MHSHTPGPWRYCPQNGSPTTGQHMIAGAKPGYLAEVRDCGSGDVKANARLIAAAPDLLAALQVAEKFMEIASDWNMDEAEINGEMRSTYDWLEVVRAAIAKATPA